MDSVHDKIYNLFYEIELHNIQNVKFNDMNFHKSVTVQFGLIPSLSMYSSHTNGYYYMKRNGLTYKLNVLNGFLQQDLPISFSELLREI